MRIIKEIVERTTIENEKIHKDIRVFEHTIRSWEELTREEKEKQIYDHSEAIYEIYQEDEYNLFLDELSLLREDFPHIEFDNIYRDSNSQGWWIDRIKDFRYNTDEIEIYGERLWVNHVDFKTRRTIVDFEIEVDDYYVECDKLRKIMATKKYQNWVKKIEEDIQKWVDRVNDICARTGDAEWNCPYDLDNENDKYFLDNYFSDMEFTDTKALEE